MPDTEIQKSLDDEGTSPLNNLWTEISETERTRDFTTGRQLDLQVAVAQIEVPNCGYSVPGERYDCSSPRVQCRTVSIELPSGARVSDIVREARESNGGPWVRDPAGGLGWCDWVGLKDDALPDGRRRISTTLKNWSHNRNRMIRLTVTYSV